MPNGMNVANFRLEMKINGTDTVLEVPGERLLVDLLREDLDLTGTKVGCGIGICGVCTVLVDGEPLSSCLLLAVQIDGASLVTIEGIAEPGEPLSPVQEAFASHGGLQCGICTPGQILAATALLRHEPAATELSIREWMMGNLCRCTGYSQIVEAISATASNPTEP
jgi:carbon-monoxide dehydrogenase small subunit